LLSTIHVYKYLQRFLYGSTILFLIACNPTKKIPDGKYLVEKNSIYCDNSAIQIYELQRILKQKPNKKILGGRFHLWLFNQSNEKSSSKINKWLRKIGEEPVIYDEGEVRRTRNQMYVFLNNKGYFYPVVSDTSVFKNKKSYTSYQITTGKPYFINNIEYKFDDSLLMHHILPDTSARLIHRGQRFDLDLLQLERERLEGLIKNLGFYFFNKEFIYYEADTSIGNYKVNLTIGFTKHLQVDSANRISSENHKRYSIRNVYIYPDYISQADNLKPAYTDTLLHDDIYIISNGNNKYTPRTLTQSVYILPGHQYKSSETEHTLQKINSLRNFKTVQIVYTEVPLNDSTDCHYQLDAHISLSAYNRQSYQAQIEGTNNTGHLGIAFNTSYQHKNLFKRAQILEFKVRGAFETLRKKDDPTIYNTTAFGSELSLSIPQLLLPFSQINFVKKYNPKTNIQLAYNYQARPDYIYTMINTNFGYNWKGNTYTNFFVNPFELTFVQLPKTTDFFNNSYYQFIYYNHIVTASSMSFIYNSNNPSQNNPSMYFRIGGELAGNILRGIYNLTDKQVNTNGAYELFNLEFAQYVKSDIDVRFYRPVNRTDHIAYRIFGGWALPYGNSRAMPFEKRYFSGGANGMRAWQIRDLGPGSDTTKTTGFPIKTADIKLEANIEYRFKIINNFAAALFVDAGNIWSVKSRFDDHIFYPNRFYKEIAINYGSGLRVDFSFFIFRFDVGIKLRDPALPENQRWKLNPTKYKPDDFGYNFGIGYPF